MNYPPDLTEMIVREQLKDREHELQAALHAEQRSGSFAYRLGDLLVRWGSRLKRAAPCPDIAQELAWPDRG